jgi:hypothetical protein
MPVTIFNIPAVAGRNRYCGIGGADFWIFWIFNLRQPAADVKCYSKTKVEKAFFLFHVILCGNDIFNSKNHKIGPKIFWK